MNRRPAHEPTRNFRPSPRLQDDANRNARWLGCRSCPDFKACGGLHTEAGIFDCGDLCSCANQETCDTVCRRKPLAFFERVMEIGGFDLEATPRVAPIVASPLPDHIPLVGHRYGRVGKLAEHVVAVPLYEIFHMGTGEPHIHSRAELAARFLIPDDAIVIATGVDRDFKVERWWEFAARAKVMQALRDLGIALVTTPNFSLFTNVPRPDNLHGMKRIALSWAELMAAGIPAALHLNARTEFDYVRWTQFVAARPEVKIVAFEFGTGAPSEPHRLACRTALRSGRRGGQASYPRLARGCSHAPAASGIFRPGHPHRYRDFQPRVEAPPRHDHRSGPLALAPRTDAERRSDRRVAGAQHHHRPPGVELASAHLAQHLTTGANGRSAPGSGR